MDSIQNISAFDQQIWDTVQEYLKNKECYPSNVVLAIDVDNYAVFIDSPQNLTSKVEQYKIENLIRLDEKGIPEPDCDATNDIANKYFFVR